MITTTLDNWQDENHPGDPQAAFDNFGRARTDVNNPRHDEAIGVSLLVLPADLGPAWEDPGHVGQPHYSTWMVPPLPFVHHKDWSKERALFGYSVLDLRDGGFQLYPPVRDMPVSGSGGPYTATSVRREVWEHQPEPTPGAP